MRHRLPTLRAMDAFAARFARSLRGGDVIALTGELGAGKTAFVKALARALGVRAVVQSPTFLLMKCYRTTRPQIQALCHVDAYRVRSARELIGIGLGELINETHTVVAIEWADRVAALIPPRARRIHFAHGTIPGERYAVTGTGARRGRPLPKRSARLPRRA